MVIRLCLYHIFRKKSATDTLNKSRLMKAQAVLREKIQK